MWERAKLALALVLCALLMLRPEAALLAALESFCVWAFAYAPVMLPFFIILPILASKEAAALYERLFAPVMALFGCPGQAAGAVILALMAGSPAGTVALSRLAAQGGMTRAQLSRAQLLCAGLSPLFLLGSVGAGMMGSRWAGMVLLRAQLGALLLCGVAFRRAFARDTAAASCPIALTEGQGAVRDAAMSLLCVCGYMAFFCVIARLLAPYVGAAWEAPLLALIEAAGGSAALAQTALPRDTRLVCIAFACGFSGISILSQNLARMRPFGLPMARLVLGKLCQGAVCALLCALQLRYLPAPREALPVASLLAPGRAASFSALAMLAALALLAAAFLHKRAFQRGPGRGIIRDRHEPFFAGHAKKHRGTNRGR